MNTLFSQTHLVLHHRDDERSSNYRNAWVGQSRTLIDAITTTREVADACQKAKAKRRSVFIHRCGRAGDAPVVCCEAWVKSVQQIDRKEFLVTFNMQEERRLTPPKMPVLGQNLYSAQVQAPADDLSAVPQHGI